MNSKLLAVIASGALALPLTVQAVDFSVSGHIGRSISFIDGPGEPESGPKWMHQDLGVSPSRFRFTGSGEAADGLTAGVNLEYAANSPSLRHSNLTFSGDFGSLAMGHTATATNGTNHDLSKTGLALDLACSNAAKSSCDGWTASRMGTVTYTTPSVGLATFSGSLARDFWDAKITSTGGVGGSSYAVSASFADSGSDTSNSKTDNRTYSLAAAFKIAAGASMAAQWGRRDYDTGAGADVDGYVVKLGYDWSDAGGVGALFQRRDMGDGPKPSTWGVGVQHNLGGVDVFAGYYSYNADSAGVKDTGTFTIGSRIMFN